MTLTLSTYLIYLTLSIVLVALVGYVLGKTNKAILRNYFGNNNLVADNVNRLVLLGYYLLNIGYITLSTHIGLAIRNHEHMFEILSYKIGIILLILAGIYFVNLWIMIRLRKKKKTVEDYVLAA